MNGIDWLIVAMAAFHIALGVGAWMGGDDDGEEEADG